MYRIGIDLGGTEIKAGVVEGELLNKDAVEELSKLPSLAEARALFLSLLSTPAGSFVRVLVAKNDKEGGAAAE